MNESCWSRKAAKMNDHGSQTVGSTTRACLRSAGAVAVGIALLVAPGCDSLLDVAPDPRAVDPESEITLDVVLNGLLSDFAQGNDLFIAWSGQFVDEQTTTFTTCTNDCRNVPAIDDFGRGQLRDINRPDPFYDYIQRPGAQAHRAQVDMLEGRFEELQSDVENSAAFALAAVIEGFSKEWAATFTCTVAYDGSRARRWWR